LPELLPPPPLGVVAEAAREPPDVARDAPDVAREAAPPAAFAARLAVLLADFDA
jgi:hypothetical protein